MVLKNPKYADCNCSNTNPKLYCRDWQLVVLEGQDLLVFHPPLTWEACVKTVRPIGSTNYLGEKRPWLDWDSRARVNDAYVIGYAMLSV